MPTSLKSNLPDATDGPGSKTPPRKNPKIPLGTLGLERYSGLYILVVLAVVFTVMLPDTFGTANNVRVIAASAAIAGILTLAVTLSMASGTFDISLAANMTFSICLLGRLAGTWGLSWPLAVLLTILAGALVGAVNAAIITRMNIEPIIVTLGMSSILAALAYWVASGQTILLDNAGAAFSNAGTMRIATVPITVYYLAGVALVLWYLLEHTPFGRYVYAIGSNPQAARLAGVRVTRLQSMSLMMSGALAALAGVVLTMQLGAAPFGAGAAYLLPAFAATFLGSTQILPGRFNVRGTVVALYLLATAVKGLQLRFPDLPWLADLVQGAVLLVAVSITARAAKKRTSS